MSPALKTRPDFVNEIDRAPAAPVDARAARLERGVTPRVIVFSLALAALFGYCIPIVDFKFSNTFLGAMHMPAAAVAVLLALVGVINPLLRKISHKLAFARNEVLTIYITCLFSSLVPGKGSETFFIPNVLSSFYFATRENKWFESLSPYLKPWMTPALNPDHSLNEPVVRGFYMGLRPGESIPWGAWTVPVIAWSAIILAIYVMHCSLAVMLRAQWAGREALSFPLLKLPLEMTKDMDSTGVDSGKSFFQNPLMWVGFGISVFIELMNGLHLYFPDVPAVPMEIATGPLFTEAPWNQLGGLSMRIFPTIVGVSYLLTSEVSFSLWFFHLFSKFEYVIAYYLGYMPAAMDAPFWLRGWAKGPVGYQQVGAILMFFILLVWTGKEHWRYVMRRAIGRQKAGPDELREALSYPVAFWTFIAALAFIIGWTIAAGMSPLSAFLLWGFYLGISLALTRLVAEGGLLFVQTGWMAIGPLAFLTGNKVVDAASAVPGSFISSSVMLDMRGFLLPSFVQGFKLAYDRKIALKPLLALIASVTLVSFFTGIWMIIRLGYQNGGLTLQNWWMQVNGSQQAQHSLAIMKGIDSSIAVNWGWVAVGAAMTWGMMVARSRFAWFPFHPIGLLMCVPFAMFAMWLSIFVGWACKVLITRFGGTSSYRAAMPLFLGMTLGGVTMVVFWVIIDAWQGRTGHALLPF